MSRSSSLPRRLLTGLARIGIDLLPLLRRGRDLLLWPLRQELASETAARLSEMQHEARVRQASVAQLEAGLSTALSRETAARQESFARLEADLSAALSREAAARQTDVEHFRAGLTIDLTRIDTVIDRTSELLDQAINGLNRAIEQLNVRLTATAAALEAEQHERRSRILGLERLLTQSPLVRLPGAAQRVTIMPSPIVSVVLPTRDRAHCIADAIASVQAQHFADWELIIVDDGSVDDTLAAVRPFLADARIRYSRQPPSGLTAARNQGQRLARGVLIAYLDSDNIWYPGFLSAAVDVLATDPTVDLVYGVLVTDEHALDATCLLCVPFDRDRLVASNFIDMNTIVHRKSLIEVYGNFDERIDRLVDWDLVLRYTQHAPAQALPVLAARYRVCDDQRISSTVPYAPSLVAIRQKWYPVTGPGRRPRVLYALWQYPHLSESYIETEIRCMRRWGVHVEVWREQAAGSPYPASVPIHDGALAGAVRQARPDLIHVHWASAFAAREEMLRALGLPVTIRLHGFDTTSDSIRAVLEHSWVHAVYAYPHQICAVDRADPRLRAVPVAFDTMMFRPHRQKDRRLVIRTTAALPSKDIPFFLELAKRLPDHRFVVAGVTCNRMEGYVDELRDIHRAMNSPAELMFDVPRETLAPLVAEAGIYLHTAKAPGTDHATPIGMPISIAEAMATGAHVFVRDLPELTAYVGEAGTPYRDVDHAAELIRASAAWSAQTWKQAWMRSVDRAFATYSDELVLPPVFEDWCAMVCDERRA